MKKVILLFLLSSQAFALNCTEHPIFCQIKKNSPKIVNSKIMKLSNLIHKASKKYNIPANIYTAILNQESGYTLEAKGCHKGLMEIKNKTMQGVGFVEVKICNDFGISQVNYRTAESYGLSTIKLISDLEYSIMAGAQVLAGFKKYSKNDKNWWLRYNCGTKGDTERDTCQIYKKLVERYL